METKPRWNNEDPPSIYKTRLGDKYVITNLNKFGKVLIVGLPTLLDLKVIIDNEIERRVT